jgi:hypothetical protein
MENSGHSSGRSIAENYTAHKRFWQLVYKTAYFERWPKKLAPKEKKQLCIKFKKEIFNWEYFLYISIWFTFFVYFM